MKDKKLKAEIWETQVLLYWLLTLALFHEGHTFLGYAALAWSLITFVGIFVLLIKAKKEEMADTPVAGGEK